MKVGSLVECTHEFDDIEPWEIVPQIGKIYTVAWISKGRWKYIILSEIKNKLAVYDNGVGEAEFDIRCFKEVLPPISNIEETINQNTLEYENTRSN